MSKREKETLSSSQRMILSASFSCCRSFYPQNYSVNSPLKSQPNLKIERGRGRRRLRSRERKRYRERAIAATPKKKNVGKIVWSE